MSNTLNDNKRITKDVIMAKKSAPKKATKKTTKKKGCK